MKNIFNLSNKKTIKQALFFYFLTVIICGILAGIISATIATLFYPNAKTFEEGQKIGLFYGPRIAMIFCFIFAIVAVVKKSLGTSIIPLMLVMVSPVLGFVFGGVGGMIPATIITLYDNKNKINDHNDDNALEVE